MTASSTSTHTYRLFKFLKSRYFFFRRVSNERGALYRPCLFGQGEKLNFFYSPARSVVQARGAFYRPQRGGQGGLIVIFHIYETPLQLSLSNSNACELPFTHLSHHSKPSSQLQRLVRNFCAIQFDPALLYHT